MDKVCMSFYFENPRREGEEPSAIIFVKQDRLIRLDFNKNVIETIIKFRRQLTKQPEFFNMNGD